MGELFNWGSETREERRLREQVELELMMEQAMAQKAKKVLATGGGGGGGGGGIASPIFDGVVLDGYISGATVTDFITGTVTTTNGIGAFSFNFIPTGKIQARDGIDITTGEPYTGTLEAPAGTRLISPVSTVISIMIDAGETLANAKKLLVEAMYDNFNLSTISDSVRDDILDMDYIKEAAQNDNDSALTIQALATGLEIIADISASILAGNDVNGDDENPELKSLHNTRKSSCWNNIASKIRNAEELLPNEIIEDVEPDTIGATILQAADFMYTKSIKHILNVANNQALNNNYRTIIIQAVNKSLKERSNSMITVLSKVGDIEDLESVLAQFGYNDIGAKFIENKGNISTLDPKRANIVEETYSGSTIKEATVNYVKSIVPTESDGNILLFGPANRIYANEFKVGNNVWSITEVNRLDEEEVKEEGYRYFWATPDQQVDYVLSGKNILEIRSLIGDITDARFKERQAHIYKIISLEQYMEDNDISSVKIPEPERIELGAPKKQPDKYDTIREVYDGGLLMVELAMIIPQEEPVEAEAETPEATRTEERKYISEDGAVEIIKVIEIITNEEEIEVVKEEFIIKKEDKKLISEADVLDDWNVEEEGEEGLYVKKVLVSAKEYVETDGEKSLIVRAISEAHYLEEEGEGE